MYCVLCEVMLCSELTNYKSEKENVILYADTLTDAARQIEEYYEKDCYAATFTFVSEEGDLFKVDEALAARLKEEASP